jgi:hypothetical protein
MSKKINKNVLNNNYTYITGIGKQLFKKKYKNVAADVCRRVPTCSVLFSICQCLV